MLNLFLYLLAKHFPFWYFDLVCPKAIYKSYAKKCVTRIKIWVLFFFACPKKNQKKTPENETARFRGGISIWLLYYCGELLQIAIHQTTIE